MEPTQHLNNIRVGVCIVVEGFSLGDDREKIWSEPMNEFLRKIHKQEVSVAVVGPRPEKRIGTKKTIRFYERFEVVSSKVLASAQSGQVELRILNRQIQTWVRVRADAVVVVSASGVFLPSVEGVATDGVLSFEAASRLIREFKSSLGREVALIGSSNRVVRLALSALALGAERCYLIEEKPSPTAWRSYIDRFKQAGGRVLVSNAPLRIRKTENAQLELSLLNKNGKMLLNLDSIILTNHFDEMLNGPSDWRQGLFYVQKRFGVEEQCDEESYFEDLDWREMYFRVARFLDLIDRRESDNAFKAIRSARKRALRYRIDDTNKLSFRGKVLDRDSFKHLLQSVSTPKNLASGKKLASLECLQEIPCQRCADECPDNAIAISSIMEQPQLIEDKCTGCGVCVSVCPSGAAVMIQENETQQKTRFHLADFRKEILREGEKVDLLNRSGEVLGAGRVVESREYVQGRHRVVEIEASSIFTWDARGFHPHAREAKPRDESRSSNPKNSGWVVLNGAKRFGPIGVPISVALWQLGYRRFEDALFCRDGGCRRCEVLIDGVPSLACKTLLRDGIEVRFESREAVSGSSEVLACVCSGVTKAVLEENRAEGFGEKLIRETTGYEIGTCKGRWCSNAAHSKADESRRLEFHGFQVNPWREIDVNDVAADDQG